MSKKRKTFLTLPNFFCSSRIILAVVLFFLIIYNYKLTALILFSIAAITDALDGHYARKFKLSSKFGEVFDETADMFLISCCFLAFFIIKEIQKYLLIIFVLLAVYVIFTVGLSYKKEKILCLHHTIILKTSAVLIYITIATVLSKFIYPPILSPILNYLLPIALVFSFLGITHYLLFVIKK